MATVADPTTPRNPQTFLDVLKYEVSRMQSAHPEREGEIARASALITLGMVTPSPDEPSIGQVLSSDGKVTYHVNGSCDCPAGQHGKDCKHLHGWRLYQYVERKVAAQVTQTPLETTSPTPMTSDTSTAPSAPTALPEAPASVNVHLTIAGRQVQLTLRDADETRLLARLQAVLAQYPVPEPAAVSQPQLSPQQHNAVAMHRPVGGVCPIHNVAMKLNHGKDGRTWHSHYDEAAGRWCKGR